MSDQLRAVLNQWEEGERSAQPATPAPTPAPEAPPRSPFQITNNLSRATFQEIKNHPASRSLINARLVAKGYKIGSVSSIVGQMLRNGLVQADDEGVLHVTVPEYAPLKNSKTLQNMKKKTKQKKLLVDVRKKTVRVEEKRPVSSSVGAGIAAIPMRPKDPPPPALLPWSVREILEMLDVLQARAVYDELKKIFGDAK
jgi:hypothetical protein